MEWNSCGTCRVITCSYRDVVGAGGFVVVVVGVVVVVDRVVLLIVG